MMKMHPGGCCEIAFGDLFLLMKYYNSKDRIEVDNKIDYKLTPKNLSAWGMLDEMYSLYVRILNSQKEAVDAFINQGHDGRFPITNERLWHFDWYYWDCNFLKQHRFQTRKLIGDFLNKNRHIFTNSFDNLFPTNDMIKAFFLYRSWIENTLVRRGEWESFDVFLCKIERLIVFVLMDRYLFNGEERDFNKVHYEMKANIHSYMLKAGYAFTLTGEYIAPLSYKSDTNDIHKFQRPFFRVFKALHLITCCLDNHEVEDEVVVVKTCCDSQEIRLPVHRCKTCGRLFLGQQTLEVYEREYGRLDFDFRYDNNWTDGCTITDSYDYEHNGESKLHQLGYNVVQDYYTEEQRHKILVNLLENEKITYFEICRDIEHAIRIFTNVTTHQEAVRKWKQDLLFIGDFVERKHYETIVP